MIRTQIQFTETQLRRIRQMARRDGISVAELVRRCVDRALADEAPDRSARWQRLLAVAGTFRDRGGRADVGDNHDAFLDEAFSP